MNVAANETKVAVEVREQHFDYGAFDLQLLCHCKGHCSKLSSDECSGTPPYWTETKDVSSQ